MKTWIIYIQKRDSGEQSLTMIATEIRKVDHITLDVDGLMIRVGVGHAISSIQSGEELDTVTPDISL